MHFNSLSFLIFLPVVYLLFNLFPNRGRWCVLLGASLIFYAALQVPYLMAVLGLVIVSTYLFGIQMERAASAKAKRVLLWSGIVSNLLILLIMKYLSFLGDSLNWLCQLLSLGLKMPAVNELVAVGVSYYVLQAMAYLFDVHNETHKAERHLGYFALYMSFFPKLLHGPIERPGSLLPQLKTGYRFDYDNVRFGLLLFTWGLFKKLVIADRLALFVDPIYGDVHAFSGLQLLLATYAFAIQIYMDFSGYTDMALGTARLFNITLTPNFNQPYLATSVPEFWRRWHITLSRWIHDYVFTPLQFQWRGWRSWGTAAAVMAAFLVSGLWHGASYSFLVWGGLHGLYVACSMFYRPYQKRLHRALGLEKSRILKGWQVFITFNLVCIGWVFFRADTLADALYVLKSFCSFDFSYRALPVFGVKHHLLVAFSLLIVLVSRQGVRSERMLRYYHALPIFRKAVYFGLVLLLVNMAVSQTIEFIYGAF